MTSLSPPQFDGERSRQETAAIFLQHANLLDHHATPYSNMLVQGLHDVVQSMGSISIMMDDISCSTTLSNYRFRGPRIAPSLCREQGTTYDGEILVDISLTRRRVSTGEILSGAQVSGAVLCRFPVMIYSDSCALRRGYANEGSHDYPGTFIVNGKRRFIPLVKTLVHNTPLFFQDKSRQVFTMHLRSEHMDRPYRSTSTLEMVISRAKKRKRYAVYSIMVAIPFVPTGIPLGLLVKALGGDVTGFSATVDTFVDGVCSPDVLAPYYAQLADDAGDRGVEEALGRLGELCRKDTKRLEFMLHLEVCPHVNKGSRTPPETWGDKLNYLGYLCARLIMFAESRVEVTDRDCQRYTRVTSAGALLASLSRRLMVQHFHQCACRLRKLACNEAPLGENVLSHVYHHTRLTKAINTAMATGNWSAFRKGITQSLITTNEYVVISQLRRLVSGVLSSDGKHVQPRVVHSSSYGYECAAETPEGEQCGLVRALALFARLTPMCDAQVTEGILSSQLAPLFHRGPRAPGDYVLFGPTRTIMGYSREITAWQEAFAELKQQMVLDIYVTAYTNPVCREWHCFSEPGRLVRPLLVLRNLHKVQDVLLAHRHTPAELRKNALIMHGCVEYVDALSETSVRVAPSLVGLTGDLRSNATHLELNDVTFLGVLAGMAPLFRHNQGPRLVYWTSMMKQVIPSPPYPDPSATVSNAMWYPQRPFTTTRVQQDLHLQGKTMGVNVIIAFLPLEWNQEDAIMINRTAIDLGMFSHTVTRAYTCTKHDSNKYETFQRPPPHTAHRRAKDYSGIEENGRPVVGTFLSPESVVIGKTIDVKTHCNTLNDSEDVTAARTRKKRKSRAVFQSILTDDSTVLKRNEKGTVVSCTENTYQNTTTVRVTLADNMHPLIGDKFSSRHAQKGTLGCICAPEDMPYSLVTGLAPEICMSPLGLTSRMTMGVLLEAILGKVVCLTGDTSQGIDEQDLHTSYNDRVREMQSILIQHGFHKSGKERYCDGCTGEQLTATVMVGCMTYVKLNHLVQKKGQARATGKVQYLNRQPTEGVSQNGGLRLGSMEIECLSAHGASTLLRERTYDTTDAYSTTICTHCGYITESNPAIGYSYCRMCNTGDHVMEAKLAYSSKLMVQELAATGIKVQMFPTRPAIPTRATARATQPPFGKE